MTSSWKAIKLRDVCSIDKARHVGKPLPYVGLEHIESGTGKFVGSHCPVNVKSATFRFGPEHLLYGRLRPYLNKVLLPDFEGHCSSEIFPLKANTQLDRRFLFHWLTWQPIVEKIDKTSTGARMPRANVEKVLQFGFLLPPLSEQKRIVAILDEAFAGIETAIANTEKNLANVRELFEGYLNSIFDRRGDGWTSSTLGEAYDVRDGTHDSPKYQATGRALVTSKNLKKSGLDFDNVKYISERDYEDIARRSGVHKGDVLFAMIGTIGNPIVVDVEPNFAIKNVALFKVPENRNGHFLKYYLRSRDVIRKMAAEAKGTTQRFVGLGYLREFPVWMPSSKEELKIVEHLTEYEQELGRLESIYQQKLSALAELKQSLLHKAFSGDLTPKTADKATKAVA